jgi:hypothetical protein
MAGVIEEVSAAGVKRLADEELADAVRRHVVALKDVEEQPALELVEVAVVDLVDDVTHVFQVGLHAGPHDVVLAAALGGVGVHDQDNVQ